MEGLTSGQNVFGAELSCRIEMSSGNRGRVGWLWYRSREPRKLMPLIVVCSIVRLANFRQILSLEIFFCVFFSIFLNFSLNRYFVLIIIDFYKIFALPIISNR